MAVKITKYTEANRSQLFELSEMCNSKMDGKLILAALRVLGKSSNAVEQSLVAKEGNRVIGFVMGMNVDNMVLFPHTMYVSPDYRGKGIGMSLLHTLEANSNCEFALIYYNVKYNSYYKKNGYTQGTDPGDIMYAAMKQLR